MVDIHSHVLWGLDDGAESPEISLAILKDAARSGTSDMVATPHLNARYDYLPEIADERLMALSVETGGIPRLHRGCEFHVNVDNVDHLLGQPGTYTINGGPYLLLECPDLHIGKHVERILKSLLDAGLTPIVAHPERHPVLRKEIERVEEWVDLGCLVQLTALSVTGGFGGSAKAACARLLERGLVHVVASDAHDPEHRHGRLDEACRAVASRYGEDCANLLFEENPRRIVEKRPIAGGRQSGWEAPPRKLWFWRSRPSL